MKDRLRNIIKDNEEMLSKLKITTDEIKNSGLDFVEYAEQVDLFKVNNILRITLFESNRLYLHILNIETEETIYFFDDYLGSDINLNDYIMQVVKIM